MKVKVVCKDKGKLLACSSVCSYSAICVNGVYEVYYAELYRPVEIQELAETFYDLVNPDFLLSKRPGSLINEHYLKLARYVIENFEKKE